MNLETYQRAAERTMLDTQPTNDAMLNAALGLCGEAAEVAKAHIEQSGPHMLEECGDLLWYAAQWCKVHDETLGAFVPRLQDETNEECLLKLWYATGQLADMTKKFVFHQKPINQLVRHLALDTVLCSIYTILHAYGWYIEEACANNNEKLTRRFPAGFTHAAANARADEAQP